MVERIRRYLEQTQRTLAQLPLEPISEAAKVLHRTWQAGGTVFVMGNGGSASLASHFANDLNKTAIVCGEKRLRSIALTDNVPLITAWANDSAYGEIFAQQLLNFVCHRDLIIGISCSGNSQNVLKAIQLARAAGARTVGMSGGTVGKLESLVDLCIHVPADDIKQIEGLHSVIMHCIVDELHMLMVNDASLRIGDGASIRKRPAVFLDRDGIINENRNDYVKSWDEFVFMPGIFEPLRALSRNHHAIVLITNQSGIGRGMVERSTVDEIHQRMQDIIHVAGGRLDAIYYCPHRPADKCHCRKPKPGLLLQAAQELDLDLANSFLIGDATSDVEAALAAGCSPVFVLSEKGRAQLPLLQQKPYRNVPVAENLSHAVDLLPSVSFISHPSADHDPGSGATVPR